MEHVFYTQLQMLLATALISLAVFDLHKTRNYWNEEHIAFSISKVGWYFANPLYS